MQINKQVRGSITNHRGKWRVVISYYDEDNNRKQKTFSTGLDAPGNKRKAEQILHDKLIEFEKNIPYLMKDTDDVSVSQWVSEILEKKSKEVRDTSMITYWSNYNTYIKDYFSDVLLRNVSPKIMDRFFKSLSERVSSSTMGTTSAILSRAFKEAVILEYIPVNPLGSIIKSKGTTERKQSKHIYNIDEVKNILTELKDEILYPVIYTTIMYGLRRGEVLAISWDDIDFSNRTINIRKTIVNVGNQTLVKEYCKTDSSVRKCTMTDDMYDLLIKHRENQRKLKIIYKDKYIQNDYDFVFCCQNGKIRSPRGLSSSYKYVLAKHGIPESRLHDLRHTAATLMFEAGADPVVVQHALGHSQLSTTMNVYVHNTDNANSQAADIMGRLLG